MCIVVDVNVFCSIFQEKSQDHEEYKPVREWIVFGKGFIVYGGTQYKEELRKLSKYLRLISELNRAGKAKQINDDLVDQHQNELKKLISDPKCNDHHLIAIFRVSGCRLLCSNDRRSDVFIKNRAYYLRNQRPPNIYRYRIHKRLLNKYNIINLRNEI